MQISEKLDDLTEDYFRSRGWLKPGENIIKYRKAGEGNMNVVMRVSTNYRNFIVKQSRPYVEKYKQVAAPIERILVEHSFYKAIDENEKLKRFSPQVIDLDAHNYTMALEDLGYGSDFLNLYQGGTMGEAEIIRLTSYLRNLHQLKVKDFPGNDKMKILNHQHIFEYPFIEDNGFDLDTVQKGLQALAMPYKKNASLKSKIAALGIRYLVKGNTLLHGDFYPGSWLKVGNEIKVIDPEFAFMGDAEFDLGVMLAHLKMAGLGDEPISLAKKSYKEPLDENLLSQYMAVEILRRLFGLAQLPLDLSLEEKGVLVEEAVELLLSV